MSIFTILHLMWLRRRLYRAQLRAYKVWRTDKFSAASRRCDALSKKIEELLVREGLERC